MNAIATDSRNDVTVVLLGHEQVDHRARALHYYNREGVPCLSLAPLEDHETFGQWQAQLAGALQNVVTPFVMLAQDADFVLGCALEQASSCLQARPQIMGIHGYALAYVPGRGKLSYHKVGSALRDAGPDSTAGMREYAEAGQQAWRAVLRVATLRQALADMPECQDAASWRVTLSWTLLTQHAIARLEQTDVVCAYFPASLQDAVRQERQDQLVRTLRSADATGQRQYQDEPGVAILNAFVRHTYELDQPTLLFTSTWSSVTPRPERLFEPKQFVELPYYNGALFNCLTEVEFLCHAWPVGEHQIHALEGVWVQQDHLLRQHPNDTAESLQERYWQALALNVFNRKVCQYLLASFDKAEDLAKSAELHAWLERLAQVPDCQPQAFRSTPSGRLLDALEAATPDDAGRKRVLAHLSKKPVPVAFVVMDLENDDTALQATFDSILASGMRDFKLVVLKAGRPPVITTARDTLHFIQVTDGNWVGHLNQVVRQLPSAWVLLLQAGDQLFCAGLLHLLVELVEAPQCQAICANEVQRDEDGRLHAVVRPGADLNLLRAQPGLMSRHWLVRRQAIVDLGGYSESHAQALELDLLLRLAETQGVGSMAHLNDYLVMTRQASQSLATEALPVLARHLKQLGYGAQVQDQGAAGLSIDYRHGTTPLVSILVTSEGDSEQLQACLTNVLQRTRYPRYELLVACANDEMANLQAFAGRVRLITGVPGASRGQQLDVLASQANGQFLLLLSARCQVITPAWIEALINEAQRPEVGVVGACLHAEDGTLAHAGYELLAGPQVHTPWKGSSFEQSSVARWPQSVRGCAAVADDCLMVRRDLFDACGGVASLPDAGIGLCVVAADHGMMVVWTPRARLLVSGMRHWDTTSSQSLAARWPAAFHGQVRSGCEDFGTTVCSDQHWLTRIA